jgi:uncharacterized membrane protein YeaQ/YmgE (transglycosylase-associated protein family)
MQAGFIAAIPALAGFVGGILGGFISDFLLRKGVSLTAARKIPSVAGMILAMLIMLCPLHLFRPRGPGIWSLDLV